MVFMSRRGAAGRGAASEWNKVGPGAEASSAPSACATLCSAASASVLDLRGALRPAGAVVEEEEDAAEIGGAAVAAGEKGGLTEPDGWGIGTAPWTGISREDMNVVGDLDGMGEPTGLTRGVVASASAVRARRGVPRADCAGEDLCMNNTARNREKG